MYGIAFEWDCVKDSVNLRKHGVGFAEAITVFDDPLSITIPDPDHTAGEERSVIIGMSSKRNLLICGSYCERRTNSSDQRTPSNQT